MAAGALTGALYKSTGTPLVCPSGPIYVLLKNVCIAGVRPALAAATVISGLAGIWSYVKTSV